MKKFKFMGILMVTIMIGVLLFTGTAAAQGQVPWSISGSNLYTPDTYVDLNYNFYTITSVTIGGPNIPLNANTAKIKEICDENGQNCKDVSAGLGASYALDTPDGTQTDVVYVNNDANVGVGTTAPQSKFAVNGTITAKEVKVTQTGWSDYVFAENYRLLPLDELETYISKEKHLPDIPTAQEVEEEGLEVAGMLTKQMQKIEELSLYLIQLKKENEELKKRITALEERR